MTVILTKDQFVLAEKAAIRSGKFSAMDLLRCAGKMVAEYLLDFCAEIGATRILFICGAGNNGGDGMVAASLLKDNSGFIVEVWFCAAEPGDNTREFFECLGDKITFYREDNLKKLGNYDVVVDAVFGIGLNRQLDQSMIRLFEAINLFAAKVISVDIPSGLDSEKMISMGAIVKADCTVTFTIPKLFHFLCPGVENVGKLIIKDLGINISEYRDDLFLNCPNLWHRFLPSPDFSCHKYSKGFGIVYGGDTRCSGAAILAARAMQRITGVVKVLVPEERDVLVYRVALLSALIGLHNEALDKRADVVLVGPGNGINDITYKNVLQALKFGKCIFDADALTVFKEDPDFLFGLIRDHGSLVIMTPHEGEFRALFGEFANHNKVERVLNAAKRSGAVVILKGADTVIASASGKAVINSNGSAKLATAGSGDVLAGMIAGFWSASASSVASLDDLLCIASMGVYMHGECAKRSPACNMIAEDLVESMSKLEFMSF